MYVAVVGEHELLTDGRTKIDIHQVGVYVRDSFDFEGRQFLGYWDETTNTVTGLNPFAGSTVTNGDFREWRRSHGAGRRLFDLTPICGRSCFPGRIVSSLAEMARRTSWLSAAVLVLVSALVYLQYFAEEQMFESVKPGGAYRLVVHRRMRPLCFALPGGGSDAPGRVVLLDRKGKASREEPVGLVNMVSDVDGHDKEVLFKPFQSWYPAPTIP